LPPFNKNQHPALFVSTYETHKINAKGNQGESSLIAGYKQQCDIVMKSIPQILEKRSRDRIPTIVEGVHLSAAHIQDIVQKLPNCLVIPFCVQVSDSVRWLFYLNHSFEFFSRMRTKNDLQVGQKEEILMPIKTSISEI
jgi:2-phosphoglycerate kinase